MPWSSHSHRAAGVKLSRSAVSGFGWIETVWEHVDLEPGEGRWVNDCPRFRFTYPNGLAAIMDYRKARRFGYSQARSTRYAMWSQESKWHSGNRINIDPRRTKKCWMFNDRIDTSKKRFLRLLSTTFHTKLKMADLDSVEVFKKLVNGVVEGKSKRWTRMAPDFEGMWNICRDGYEAANIGKEQAIAHVLCDPYRFGGRVDDLRWRNVRRGRELFLLWKFNIPEAVAEMLDSRSVIQSPSDLIGHVYHASYWNLTRNQRVIPYVKRWMVWFRGEDDNGIPRMRRVDEIPPDVDMRMHPDQALVENLRGTIEAIPPEHEYSISRQLPTLEYKGLVLSPIKTGEELEKTATKLHNCAKMYHPVMNRWEAALIVCRDSKRDDKIVALGELGFNQDFKRRGWVQKEGPCRASLDRAQSAAYRAYLKTCPKELEIE